MAFKDKYMTRWGSPLVPSDFARKKLAYYSSKTSANGDGSYNNPAKVVSPVVTPHVDGGVSSVLSGGHFGNVHIDSKASITAHESIIGQGMFNTYINDVRFAGVGYFNVSNLSIAGNIGWGSRLYLKSCRLLKGSVLAMGAEFGRSMYIQDCLFNIFPNIPILPEHTPNFANISYADVADLPLDKVYLSSNAIADKCDIIVSALGAGTGYISFSNCRYKIGAEGTFTPLAGIDAPARRAEFIARCTEQGIACPTVSDLGVSAKLQRWDFEDDSVVDGAVIEGSELDIRNNRRGFYMGYTKSVRTIPLTSDSSAKGHFSENNKGFEVANNELYVDGSITMTQPNALAIDSSVIPLNGRMQLDSLDVVHTFSSIYGLHLRNGNDDIASKNIALLRSVDNLPPAKIRTGALLASFWYLVTYDTPDVKDSGYVEYNGKKYYFGDAILVRAGITAFTIPAQFANKVHLRECWHTDFANNKNPNNENAAFWNGEQLKPNWMPVVLDDLRAQFKNDNESTGTIKEVNGVPMTSGADGFYPQLVAGTPAFPLYGSFLQVRLKAMTGDERSDRTVRLSAGVKKMETGGQYPQWDVEVIATRAVASNITVGGETIFMNSNNVQVTRAWTCTIPKGATVGRNAIETVNETEDLTTFVRSATPANDSEYDYKF